MKYLSPRISWVILIIFAILLIVPNVSAISQYNSTVGSDNVIIFNGTGSTTWTAPDGVTSVWYLVIAGGGGGGDRHGGGGGAGGLLNGTTTNISGGSVYTIVVGAGAGGAGGDGSDCHNTGTGGSSTFNDITTTGGGNGGAGDGCSGTNGGSGGGATDRFGSDGGSNVSGQGWAGGSTSGSFNCGGGGGGAGAAGTPGTCSGNVGPLSNGGDGIPLDITGTLTYYAGGGGAGTGPALGGLGGGGNGGYGYAGTTGTNDLGGGGGGADESSSGGNGGSGVVIIRYTTSTNEYTSHYPSGLDTGHIIATSSEPNYYIPNVIDITQPLTDTDYDNQWYSVVPETTNQKIHVNLDSPMIITRIYYENSHNAGVSTNLGAKSFTLWGSNSPDAYWNVTYSNDTGWNQLPTDISQFVEHTGSDISDPHYVYVTNSVPYQYYGLKIADNYGGNEAIGLRRIEFQTGTNNNPSETIVASHTWATWYADHYWQPSQMVMPLENTTGLNDVTKLTLTADSCDAGSGSYSGDLKTGNQVTIGTYSVTWSNGVFEWLTSFTGDTSPSSINGHVYFDGFSSVAPSCAASGDTWTTSQLGTFNGVSGTGTSYASYTTVVAPLSNFTSNVTSGSGITPVSFTDSSTNTPTSWEWTFQNSTGNNTQIQFSTSQNPTYTFGVGNYSIKLNSSNSAGFDITSGNYFINISESQPTGYFEVTGNPAWFDGNVSIQGGPNIGSSDSWQTVIAWQPSWTALSANINSGNFLAAHGGTAMYLRLEQCDDEAGTQNCEGIGSNNIGSDGWNYYNFFLSANPAAYTKNWKILKVYTDSNVFVENLFVLSNDYYNPIPPATTNNTIWETHQTGSPIGGEDLTFHVYVNSNTSWTWKDYSVSWGQDVGAFSIDAGNNIPVVVMCNGNQLITGNASFDAGEFYSPHTFNLSFNNQSPAFNYTGTCTLTGTTGYYGYYGQQGTITTSSPFTEIGLPFSQVNTVNGWFAEGQHYMIAEEGNTPPTANAPIAHFYMNVSTTITPTPQENGYGIANYSGVSSDPIGGGAGYSDIKTTGDYVVTTLDQFRSHMVGGSQPATAGQIVFIPSGTTITFPAGDTPEIPAGVILASDRGYNGHAGAILKKSSSSGNWEDRMLDIGGDNVRITGLQLEGEMYPSSDDVIPENEGMYLEGIKNYGSYTGEVVDNNEIRGWAYSGVEVKDVPTNGRPWIHNNYFHHNQARGEGYGIEVYGGDALIEGNLFNYNRHDITGTGKTGEKYEFRYNIIMGGCDNPIGGTHIDVHESIDETSKAGDTYLIHHNTVYQGSGEDQEAFIHVRDIPAVGVYVYNNDIQSYWGSGSNYDGAHTIMYQSHSQTRDTSVWNFPEFITNNKWNGITYSGTAPTDGQGTLYWLQCGSGSIC